MSHVRASGDAVVTDFVDFLLSLCPFILRPLCLQPASLQEFPAVSASSHSLYVFEGTSVTTELFSTIMHCLTCFFLFLSFRCEFPSSASVFHIRCFKTSAAHSMYCSNSRHYVLTSTLLSVQLTAAVLFSCRGWSSDSQNSSIRRICYRGGCEVGERLV